jgi:hypothetical protein
MMKKKAKNEEKCKTVAAAVVKGKIYFYCLKEIWNSHTTSRDRMREIFTLYCVTKREFHEFMLYS